MRSFTVFIKQVFTPILAIIISTNVVAKASYAQIPPIKTEVDFIEHITELENNPDINPIEMLDQISELVSLSQKNEWQAGYVQAANLKLGVLVNLENIDSADKLYKELLPKAQALNDQEILIEIGVANLSILYAKGATKGISSLYSPLIESAKKIENMELLGDVYLAIGNSQYNNSQYADAISSLKTALNVFNIENDVDAKSSVLSSLGNIYIDIEDYDLGIQYLEEALALTIDDQDLFIKSIALYNLGNAHMLKKDWVKAQQLMTEAFEASEELEDDIGMAWAQGVLGQIAIENEQFENAIVLLNQALAVFVDVGDRQLEVKTLIHLSRTYVKTEQLSLAISNLERAKLLNIDGNSKTVKRRILQLESEIALLQERFEDIYTLKNQEIELLEEIYKDEIQQDTQRYKVEFDSELTQSKNETLIRQNELNALLIEQQKQQEQIWMVVFILVVLLFLIVVFLLIVQTKNRNRFKEMALRDPLTSSPNRRAILQYARERLQEAQHTNMPLSIALIDLDSFKLLNDTFGHDVGDEVLKMFAKACEQVLRQQDRYGRYGGEEWLFVISDTQHENIKNIFERLREYVNSAAVPGLPDNHTITFSMGVVHYEKANTRTVSELISLADKKLYQAKQNGRDQIVL
jgi:diguanylate cyclase (GGDEF)-like protein